MIPCSLGVKPGAMRKTPNTRSLSMRKGTPSSTPPAGTRSLNEATMYVTRFPCGECAKEIAQAGISRVVYGQMKHNEDESVAMMIFNHAGIICEALE